MSDLIYDRTQADVDQWERLKSKGMAGMTAEERERWTAGMKGAYNAADMNRVSKACGVSASTLCMIPDLFRNTLEVYGIAPDDAFLVLPYDPDDYDFTPNQSWAMDDIPTREELDLYLRRVALLRAAMDYETDELPESMDGLTVYGANAIEKALALLTPAINEFLETVFQRMDNTKAAWFYSGDLYAGEL